MFIRLTGISIDAFSKLRPADHEMNRTETSLKNEQKHLQTFHPHRASQTNRLEEWTQELEHTYTHRPIWTPVQALSYLSQTGYSPYQYCMNCLSNGAMLNMSLCQTDDTNPL